MRTNTQTLPVETWETKPKLQIVERNGDKTSCLAPKAAVPPNVFRQERRELEVLGWEVRVGRLVSLSRSRG
jgi:hypothetical protein